MMTRPGPQDAVEQTELHVTAPATPGGFWPQGGFAQIGPPSVPAGFVNGVGLGSHVSARADPAIRSTTGTSAWALHRRVVLNMAVSPSTWQSRRSTLLLCEPA